MLLFLFVLTKTLSECVSFYEILKDKIRWKKKYVSLSPSCGVLGRIYTLLKFRLWMTFILKHHLQESVKSLQVLQSAVCSKAINCRKWATLNCVIDTLYLLIFTFVMTHYLYCGTHYSQNIVKKLDILFLIYFTVKCTYNFKIDWFKQTDYNFKIYTLIIHSLLMLLFWKLTLRCF